MMIKRTRTLGPIELKFARSSNPQLRRLCQMSNLELLDYMDELIEEGENLDEPLFDAVEQLLDERAPIERPSTEEVIRSWERFKAKHTEVFQTKPHHKGTFGKRTYTLRQSLALASVFVALTIGIIVLGDELCEKPNLLFHRAQNHPRTGTR